MIQNDKNWKLVPTQGFANPFATGDPIDPADPVKGKKPKPGDPVAWNVTTIGDRVLVSYVISKAPDKPVPGGPAFDAGEEDSLNSEQEKATRTRASWPNSAPPAPWSGCSPTTAD